MAEIYKINSGIEGADENDAFMITSDAINAIKEVIKENNVPDDFYVRIATESGGCCGLNFYIEFDNDYDKTRDRILDELGVKFIVDNETIFQLLGVTLDFEVTDEDAGFLFRGLRDEGHEHHHHHH